MKVKCLTDSICIFPLQTFYCIYYIYYTHYEICTANTCRCLCWRRAMVSPQRALDHRSQPGCVPGCPCFHSCSLSVWLGLWRLAQHSGKLLLHPWRIEPKRKIIRDLSNKTCICVMSVFASDSKPCAIFTQCVGPAARQPLCQLISLTLIFWWWMGTI